MADSNGLRRGDNRSEPEQPQQQEQDMQQIVNRLEFLLQLQLQRQRERQQQEQQDQGRRGEVLGLAGYAHGMPDNQERGPGQ